MTRGRIRRGYSSGIGTAPPTILKKTEDYTLDFSDEMVLVDATGGAVTVTLPRMIDSEGRKVGEERMAESVTVKKTDSSGNAVTVTQSVNAETIDGATGVTLATQNTSVTLVTDYTNWFIVGEVT